MQSRTIWMRWRLTEKPYNCRAFFARYFFTDSGFNLDSVGILGLGFGDTEIVSRLSGISFGINSTTPLAKNDVSRRDWLCIFVNHICKLERTKAAVFPPVLSRNLDSAQGSYVVFREMNYLVMVQVSTTRRSNSVNICMVVDWKVHLFYPLSEWGDSNPHVSN